MPAHRGSLNGGAIQAPPGRPPSASHGLRRPSTHAERSVADDDPRLLAFSGLIDAIDGSDVPAFCEAVRQLRSLKIDLILTGDGVGDGLDGPESRGGSDPRIGPFKALIHSVDHGDALLREASLRGLVHLGISITTPEDVPCP